MARSDRVREVTEMCERAGCSEKIRKIHFEQYVDRRWHPHPSTAFTAWWSRHPDCKDGPDAKRAWNCQRYVDEFMEAKQIGLTI